MSRRLAVIAAGLVLLAACTGVPDTSAPQTIQPIGVGDGGGSTSISAPYPESARDVVSAFLDANADENSAKHASARRFLAPAERNRWGDTTATIVDNVSVGTYLPGKPVQVVGRRIGRLDPRGIYMPELGGVGDGGPAVTFQYQVERIGGEFRLVPRQSGLVLTLDQFRSAYEPHTLYFFDLANRYLVPDVRYSPFHDPTQLANWMLDQLTIGPRPDLMTAVNSDSLPGTTSRPLSARVGVTTEVEIPGARGLDAQSRNRLAEQVGKSLADPTSGSQISITDNGKAVKIPVAKGTTFIASQFDGLTAPDPPAALLYYLDGGRVVGADGKPLSGPGIDGATQLASVALAGAPSGQSANGLSVAAGVGPPGFTQLYVGSQERGLRPTSVHGELTRPAWAPGRPEVWVASGSTLWRVTVGNGTARASKVPLALAAGGGQIEAVRISPEGTRIALVLHTGPRQLPGTGQLNVGTIVRAGGKVRIDSLTPISPQGVFVNDVAWNDPVKLLAIGQLRRNEAKVCETTVDGSGWSLQDNTGMPGPPDSLTVTAGSLAWVSVLGTVWQQSGAVWTSPGPSGQTFGTNPVYLE